MLRAGVAAAVLSALVVWPTLRAATTATQEQGRSIWEGVFTDQQAVRGETVFQAQCASCHAAMNSGGGSAPPLSGSDFIERWADQAIGEIFATMRTTMPPGAPASLSKEMYVDILAYVLKANKYPPGGTELPPDAATLAQIVIEQKPR